MMNAILEARNLSKRYGSAVALDGISFALTPGRIYGLLGRNGAGKTTLLHIFANRLFPSAGEVLCNGECITENDEVLREIFCMGEAMPYPEGMRVAEVLRLGGCFYPRFDAEKAAQLLQQFQLSPRTKMKALSTGYASILKLIVGLCCNARILLFDEPVLGLDANHRELFYHTLLELYAAQSPTILLSTHLIEEAADIVEEALIIDAGKLLVQDSVEALRERAVMVSGSAAAVDAAVAGRQVLSMRTLGAEKAACVLGSYDTAPAGVTLSRLGLQELFVQLTNANTASIVKEGTTYAS